MTIDDWKKYPNFNLYEPWGNPQLIQEELVEKLQRMRDASGLPFTVNYGTQGKHAENSMHYLGLAVDGFFNAPLLDQYIWAVRAGFTGIGLYPEWNHSHGGIHVDIRKTNHVAMWIQHNKSYIALNKMNLKISGVI